MNSTSKVASLFYALVLVGCAYFAWFDTFAFAFAIGEGGGQASFAIGALLIGTLAGGAGLAITSLGSWTRWRAVSLIGLVSALLVLPSAVLYGWLTAKAFWMNTHLGMHFGPWAWASAILPPILGLTAAAFSWLRFRRLKDPVRVASLTR